MSESRDENRTIAVVASVILAPLFCGLMGFVAGPVLIPPGTDMSGPAGLRQALTGAGVGLLIGILFALANVYRLLVASKGTIGENGGGPASH